MEDWQEWGYLKEETLIKKNDRRYVLLAITSDTVQKVLVLPSLLVLFIKSLFLKEIISSRAVDSGGRIVEYSLQRQLKSQAHGYIETYRVSVYDKLLWGYRE